VQINIADGGHNNFDIGDPCFRQSAFQNGQLMVAYAPKNQLDMNWIADTLFRLYGNEGVPFIGPAYERPGAPALAVDGREHVFRSMNQGRNPIHHEGDAPRALQHLVRRQRRRRQRHVRPTKDICDDWKPMGDPVSRGV
jgi:hypothetical protein